MQKAVLSPMRMGIILAGAFLLSGAVSVAVGKILGGVEVVRLKGELGYVQAYPGSPMLTGPYNRETLEKIVQKACAPDVDEEVRLGSEDVRWGSLGLLTDIIQFWQVPPHDLDEVVRLPISKLAAELGEGNGDRLAREAKRCLWNAEYALTLAKLEGLESEAKELANSSGADYAGDLITWRLHTDAATGVQRFSELANLAGQRRTEWAVEKCQLHTEIRRCKTTEEAAELLISVARGTDKSEAIRGYALRRLSDYPTEQGIKFLHDTFEKARERGEFSFGLEAQEALKRLKEIPQGVHRYTSF